MSAKNGRTGNEKPTITLIRKEEVIEGGHHGGAWKVAYADFVTAMMAFFLLMWLLNATTEDQRRGIADYFSPISALGKSLSGTGLPFGGKTPFSQGAYASDRGAVQAVQGRAEVIPDVQPDDSTTIATPRQYASKGNATEPTDGALAPADSRHAAPGSASPAPSDAAPATPAAAASAVSPAAVSPASAAAREQGEPARFAAAAEQIRRAVQDDPSLAQFAGQLSVDLTPDGLRIQILDEDRQPMFATGSAIPNERARMLVQKVAPALLKMSEAIAVVGHTDAAPYRGGDRSNWELSADRANATRRLLADAGLPDTRIRSVSGDADRDPLLPADPLAAANRRIAILVLRDAPGPRAAGPAAARTAVPAPPTAPEPR